MPNFSPQIDEQQLREMRQENIGRMLLRAHRAFSQRAFQKLHERGHTGLGLTHTALLANLDLEGTRITVLAERADMTKQSMGELVQELEEKGYVDRIPDPTDRRATLVRFTQAGCKYLEDAYLIKVEIEAEYAALLGENGLADLRHVLTTLTTAEAEPPPEDQFRLPPE